MTQRQTPTREEVYGEVWRFCKSWSRDHSHSYESKTDLAMHILAHFAPARTMIEGMSVEQITKEIALTHPALGMLRCTYTSETRMAFAEHAARVAHHLANTPAPVVDPDANAMAAFWKFMQGHGEFLPGPTKRHWDLLTENERNGWRAVAAAEKSNG